MNNVLIIIPTFNEVENILRIIKSIFSLHNNINILVVDDNSPDGTSDIIKSFNSLDINLITRKAKLGLGSAYIEGFNWAINNNFDYVVQMDADLSHNPKDISKLTQKAGQFDLIIGSRYINGISIVNWPLSRLILSYLANLYARLIIGIPILDVTGGFKCISTRLLKQINLNKIKSLKNLLNDDNMVDLSVERITQESDYEINTNVSFNNKNDELNFIEKWKPQIVKLNAFKENKIL